MASADFILGNTALHERVRILTEVLGKFVSSAPRALSIHQLHEHTGVPEKQLVKLCQGLLRAALLQAPVGKSSDWKLAREASAITLEDVVRCAIAEQPVRARGSACPAARPVEEGMARDVDLLVMQATVSVNQSVYQHLRKFPLDRLNLRAAPPQPARKERDRYASQEAYGWQAPRVFS